MSTPRSATTSATEDTIVVPAPTVANPVPPVPIGSNVATGQPAVTRRMTRSRALTLAAIAALVVAVLALPRRSALVHDPAADAKSEAVDSTAQPTEAAPAVPVSEVEPPAAPVAPPDAEPPIVSEPVKRSPAKSPVATATKRLPTAMPAVDVRTKETPEVTHAGIEPAAIVTAPAPVPSVPETPAVDEVTITGCLEASAKDRFRLTDTEGAGAPKARSWRSGFLKKHSAAVDLVGARDVAALQQQVGQRVAVTGVQTNRNLTVGSVRVVSASCN